MRVVVDTSVVVSAALRDRDPEKVLTLIADRSDLDWIVSRDILDEYAAVLRRPKFNLPDEIVHRWLTLIDSLTFRIDVDVKVDFPRDPNDAKFLSCALAGEADFPVTSDRDFSQATRMERTYIVSVPQFLSLLAEPS